MAEPENPEEEASEVEDETAKFLRANKKVLDWKPPANEYELTESSFDVAQAWEALLTLPTCQEMLIKESSQKRFNLEVGVNVTQEFPWKQIRYRELRDLFDELQNGQLLHNAFQGYDLDSHILLGYVPIITQDLEEPPPGDPFILFISPADVKLALAIIRNLETFERLMINKRIIKKPGKWISLGSENEVDLTIVKRYHEPIDIEIQSVYPLTIPADKKFSFRLSNDVRDGYVELVPSEGARFENISRRRLTIAIQSAPVLTDMEQQTNPKFPTNSWSQYLYEVNEDDDCLDEESEEEKPMTKPNMPPPPPVPKPPLEISDNIKLLLKTLDFNLIDLYRNDYPLISNKCVMYYTSPYLEETLCFANIAKSHHRYVCGYDWYPALAGLIVTSYTFTTAATIESITTNYDAIQRTVLEHKPILMWSFSDNLNYKLEFETSLEVVTLSFCPYEPNVLLGGASNGQIVLFDLQNRAENLDVEEMLSSAQISYRLLMNDYLKWTILINEDIIVSAATVSSLDHSQKGIITSIQWLGSNCAVNSFGKLYIVPRVTNAPTNRYFMTCSMDGTIAFWNLDNQAGKKVSSALRRDLPKALTQSESVYKGRVLRPVFIVAFNEPLTSFIADTPLFTCTIKEKEKDKAKNAYNYRIQSEEIELADVRQYCIASTFYGHVERLTWLGLYADSDGREAVHTSVNFARVHDGPVIALKRNRFFPWLFVSVGRTVFAVWKEDYNHSPIFWRKRKCDLTAVMWSESRPSVLFLTRIDGSIEAWDILCRDDDAILNDTLGGGIVTNVCENKIGVPEKLLGIGDYNSSLRMVKLPRSLYSILGNEFEDMEDYILKEESRKKQIQEWEQKYYEKNKSFIEAKLQAEEDAHREMERLEKEALQRANRKAKEEEEAKKAAEPVVHMSYTERMKKQWYELNLKRLLGILMSRKRVNEKQLNEETVLEKERLAYEMAKKESLAQVMSRVADEVAAIRLRILPLEIPDLQRNDMIQSSVRNILQTVEPYKAVENEGDATINEFESFENIDYTEFLNRGQHRRKYLNKSLGGATERLYWYENVVEQDLINECDWGLETNAELLQIGDLEWLLPRKTSLLKVDEQEDEEEGADGDKADVDAAEVPVE